MRFYILIVRYSRANTFFFFVQRGKRIVRQVGFLEKWEALSRPGHEEHMALDRAEKR